MKYLAFTLLLGVFVMNYGYRELAEGTRFSQAAVFYMLMGIWIAYLAAIALAWAYHSPVSVWRVLAIDGALIAVIEALQMPVCRYPITDIRAVPTNVNLCDYVTGLPVYLTMLCLYLIIIVESLIYYANRSV